jgi:hypothetical protein
MHEEAPGVCVAKANWVECFIYPDMNGGVMNGGVMKEFSWDR